MIPLTRILVVAAPFMLISAGLNQRAQGQDAPPTNPAPTPPVSVSPAPATTPTSPPAATPAPAPGSAPRQVQAPAPNPADAYYSWRMQAHFVIQTIDLTPYGWAGYRPVAQLVAPPSPYSPIARLGLRPGDMITRIDDVPISTYADLDSHYTLTKLTFLRQGFYYAQQAWVDLGPLYPGVRPPVYPGRVLVDPAPYPRPPRIVRPWPFR